MTADEEKELARKGKVYANHLFRNAKEIEFKDLKWDKYGGRILSNVYLDGELYSEPMRPIQPNPSFVSGQKVERIIYENNNSNNGNIKKEKIYIKCQKYISLYKK